MDGITSKARIVIGATLLGLCALTACTASEPGARTSEQPTAPASSSGVATPSRGATPPSTQPSTVPTPSTGASSTPPAQPSTPSTQQVPPTQPTSPTQPPRSPSSSSPPAGVAPCNRGNTALSLGRPDGAAGSVYIPLTVTNTSSSSCVLAGFPGVSLVYGDAGAQLGAAAGRTGETGSVVVRPGAAATTTIRLVQAGNYPTETCQPQPAKGFRVYLPNQKDADFVPLAGYQGCRSTSVPLLSVTAFHR